jgi:hypothetical protein
MTDWNPGADIQASVKMRSEIVIGASFNPVCRLQMIAPFVSEMIERDESTDLTSK